MAVADLVAREPGELAFRVVAEVVHGGGKQQDREFANDAPSAGRGAGWLAHKPQAEVSYAEVGNPYDGGVVAGLVEEPVAEPLSGDEVRPESPAAEREGVQRFDPDAEGYVSWPLRPDLVACGGVLLQLGVPPSDEDSAEDPVVVGGDGQSDAPHGLAAPVDVPVQAASTPDVKLATSTLPRSSPLTSASPPKLMFLSRSGMMMLCFSMQSFSVTEKKYTFRKIAV